MLILLNVVIITYKTEQCVKNRLGYIGQIKENEK